MEPSTALGASAQLAVAIAGFAGVVTVFRSQSVHDWGKVEKFWLRLLLTNSILPLALSMFGLFLLSIADATSATWRWCSGFAAALMFPYAVMILRNLVAFAPGQLEAAGGTRLASYALFTLLVAVCLLQLLNTLKLAAFWPFFGATVALLMGAIFQFLHLVLSTRRPSA